MIRTDEKTASCPEAEHTAIPETPFSCNLAETWVLVSCAVTCHFGAMSSVTDARVVGKACRWERQGPQLGTLSVSVQKKQQPLRFLGGSCFRSSSSISYNKCFMTNANKSQLWNSIYAMSKPVQNHITTLFEFSLLCKCIPYEPWCLDCWDLCIHSESCF